MLREFVERKVRRQIVRVSQVTAAIAFSGIFVLWNNDQFEAISHPLRMFVNNVHGALSAMAIQLTGGAVESFTLSSRGSYLIEYTGGAEALILPAGYIGSAILGAALFFLVNRAPHLVRGLAAIVGVFTVGFLALFVRPDATGDIVSLAICIGFGLLLILLGWKGKGDINKFLSLRTLVQVVMNTVALTTALHILLDLPYVLSTPGRIDGVITNTVAAFSESVMPALSVNVVAFAWAAISIVLLGAAAYAGVVRPMKQIRKNDDIV